MIYIYYYPRQSYKTEKILNHFINTQFKDVLIVYDNRHYRNVVSRFHHIISKPLIKYLETHVMPYDGTQVFLQERIDYYLELFKSRVIKYNGNGLYSELRGMGYDNLIFDDLHPSYFKFDNKNINIQLNHLYRGSDIQIVCSKYGFEYFDIPHMIKHDTKIVGGNQYVSHGTSKFSL